MPSKTADAWAKMTAENTMDADTVLKEYMRKTSFSHLTRMATEAGTRGVADWIVKHVPIHLFHLLFDFSLGVVYILFVWLAMKDVLASTTS